MYSPQDDNDAETPKPATDIRKKRFHTLACMTLAGVTCVTPFTNLATTPTPGLWLTPPQNSTNRLAYMPDSSLTPGDKLAVTKTDVCAPRYGLGVHDVPTSYKQKIFASYGLTAETSYVIDRLISIDLGGANTIKNLWPQPTAGEWNSQLKDQLERELRRRVCNGSLDLQTAQQEIAKDWVAAYSKYLGGGKSKPRIKSSP